VYLSTWRPDDKDGCSKYNEWKYGLDDRNTYAELSTRSQMIDRVLRRRIHYIVGSDDTEKEDICEANAQGPTRVQRMWNYSSHLWSVCSSRMEGWACAYLPFAARDAFEELSGFGHTSRLLATPHAQGLLYGW
jgi:hypothetical protein